MILLCSASAEDAVQLAAWWDDGAVMAHAGFPLGLGTTPEAVAEKLGHDSDERGERLIIERGGTAIGEMNYRVIEAQMVEIGIEICDSDEQNRGQGRILLSMLIGELFKRGFTRITLDTNLTNTRAQHVYESLGFRRLGVRMDSWRDQMGNLQSAVNYELVEADFVNYANL